MKNNNIKLNNQLNCYNNQKITAIKKIYMGSSAFLITTPMYVNTINIEDLPIIVITLLEIGLITIPIKGIIDIIKTSHNIKLIKEDINKNAINNKQKYLRKKNNINNI